jgi:hypothetical protein
MNNLIRLDSGLIINPTHVLMVEKENLYLLGLGKIPIAPSDYFMFEEIAEASDIQFARERNAASEISISQSMRMLTELIMHFVAHSIAFQQGTLNQFPLNAVFERIANIMNEINSSMETDELEENAEDEDEENNEEQEKE